MGNRLVSLHAHQRWFSPFVDVAINGMAAMFVFLAVYVAAVPPRKDCVPCPPPKILTTHLPEAIWYKGYETAICASGGAGNYAFELDRPDELEKLHLFFNQQSGIISGTPTPAKPEARLDSYAIQFLVKVTDTIGHQDHAELELKIVPLGVPFDPQTQALVLAMESRLLPDAWTGVDYEFAIPILGGIEPYETICEGLPLGLELKEGRIFGDPHPSVVPMNVDYQDYNVRLTVMDKQSDLFPPDVKREPILKEEFKIRVNRLEPIRLRGILPHARIGQEYTGVVSAVGGREKLVWDLVEGDLASYGLQLNTKDGTISGTVSKHIIPGKPVRIFFRIRVADRSGSVPPVEEEFNITLLPPMHFTTHD